MANEKNNIEEILARVKSEESNRGKLKIFFGAMAGVGKTYSMLEAARVLKKEGIDVVVGYIETHGRADTDALLEGLEILPRKEVPYKNIKLSEFDVDSALKRCPSTILVDELAHSNASGSRHPKRWQDVEELLDAGINVYTTLNVQHCDSANDVVAQITGVTVRETVPDTFVEKADDIELVDLSPEDLLKRLKEGKVYLGEQAQRAIQNFFQIGNLIALRQLALQYTSRTVDARMRSYKQAYSITKVWNVRDRLLVCISASPRAMQLIRAGKRIASSIGVEWIVAYVDPISQIPNRRGKADIAEMMRLAERLGAETITLSGLNVAETIIDYARSRNITKIIIGKPRKPKWHEFLFGSVINALARKCGEIDLYLMSGESQEIPMKHEAPTLRPFPWKGLLWTIGTIVICTAIDGLLFKYISLVNLIMVYFLSVTWIAFRYGRRMSILASILSVLCFDFFFVPPYFTFAVANVEYFITFGVMLVVGVIIGSLTGRLRQQTMAMRLRENRTQALYYLNRDLAKTSNLDEIFQISVHYVQEFFKCPAVIFTPTKGKGITIRFGDSQALPLNPNEEAVAQWVYEHKKMAGKDTDTLPGSRGIYLPLTGAEKTVGVIGLFPREEKQLTDPDQLHTLEIFVNQTASAVEGAQLAATAIKTEADIESERLRNLLLSTFSLDLPAPLKIISEAAAELPKPDNINDKSKRNELIQKIREEAKRLSDLSSEMTKIIKGEE
ncbi:MAG: sensor histidine kinase KdpD [Candidatus Omnitrophica bacterium]|nr:sensor histidine kinase KdpD [Candidatus Omnitrophota bacterium]